MLLSKYLLNCDKTICGAHFSDRFCIGYLDRFFISISIKIVTCNYRVKCHIVFVSTTFENISNFPSKGTDKHQMQLINKYMNFSVRAYHATLSLFFLYLCLLLSNLHIPKFVLETQIPYIRNLLQFFQQEVAPKNWKEVYGGEREFLQQTKDISQKRCSSFTIGGSSHRLSHYPLQIFTFFTFFVLGRMQNKQMVFPPPRFSLFSYLGRCEIIGCYPPILL